MRNGFWVTENGHATEREREENKSDQRKDFENEHKLAHSLSERILAR